MKLNSTQNRKSNRGIGTVDGLVIAAIACYAIHWAYGEIKEKHFASISDYEAVSLAKEVISMAEAAKNAGLDFIDESSVNNTIIRVTSGTTARNGAFAGQYFGLPQLNEKNQKIISKHLTIQGGKLSLNDKPSIWFD